MKQLRLEEAQPTYRHPPNCYSGLSNPSDLKIFFRGSTFHIHVVVVGVMPFLLQLLEQRDRWVSYVKEGGLYTEQSHVLG
jgi:hypothetical protein